jgi:autotransporter-associated beta strand protein
VILASAWVWLAAASAFAANGTTIYFDVNGTAAGFGVPGGPNPPNAAGPYNLTGAFWDLTADGTGASVAFPSGDALTIGSSTTTFAPPTFTIDLNFGNNLNGIVINSTGINVTFTTENNNVHPTSSSTWTVVAGSSLTLNGARQTFADTIKSLNWNNQAITFNGGGTFNFLTPFGCNSTANNTENNTGGVVNLLMGSIASTTTTSSYTGGFTLTAGTLNFASAGSSAAFIGFAAGKPFSITGGIIDNTSGSPMTLLVGPGGYSIGGNFTFTGSSNLDFGTAPIAIAAARQVTVSAGTLAMSGTMTGAGGLTLVGPGTLVLSGANTNTGATTVTSGTLRVANTNLSTTAGSTGTGAVNLNGGTLASLPATTSYIVGNVVAGTGAHTVAPGGLGSVGALGVGGMTVSNNMTLNIDVNANVGNDQIVVAATNGTTGTGTVGGATPAGITLNFLSLPTSSFTVLSEATPSNLTGMFSLNTMSYGRETYSLDATQLTNGIVQVNVAGAPASISWNNAGGTGDGVTWNNAQVQQNWSNGGTPDAFFDGDTVTFNDTNNGHYTVSITGPVRPSSMTVTNGGGTTYVFNDGGSGSIATGSLLLNSSDGTGTLTINTTNTFNGGTTVQSGKLNANAAGALGSGPIALSGGTLNLGIAGAINAGSTITINSGTLDNTSAGTITLPNIPQVWAGNFTYAGTTQSLNMGTGAVTLNSTPTITVSNNTLTVGGVISNGGGAAITKDGGGTLALTANNTFTGGLTILAGSVRINGSGGKTALGSGAPTVNGGGTLIGVNADSFGFAPNAAPLSINIAGGTVTDLGTANYRITLPNLNFTGGTLTSAVGNAGDANGNYSLFGDSATATVTSNAAATTAVINAAKISFQRPAVFNVAAGSVVGGPAPGVDLLVSSNIVPNGVQTVTINGPGILAFDGNNTYGGATTISGGTLQIGLASDAAPLPSPLGTAAVTNNAALTFASSQAINVSNVINGTGTVTQTGSGTATLAAANGYTGATTINAGTISVTGSLNAGSAVAVNNGGTLAGTGTVNGAVTVNNGGMVANFIGGTTLTLAGGLTIGSAGTETATINVVPNTVTPSTAPILVGSSAMFSLGGAATGTTVNVFGGGLTAGQTYALVAYTGSIGGTTGFGALTLGTLPPRVLAHLSNDPGAVDLVVTGVDFPVWTGAASSEWSTNTIAPPKNWVLDSNNAATTDYIQGDAVLFNDNAGVVSTSVDISAADVTPGAVNFNNSTHDYTLTGTFGIAGLAVLTKNGSGALTITNANSFSGGTVVQNGTLNANAAASLGTGPLTASGGVTNLNAAGAINSATSLVTVNGGTLNLSVAGALGNNPVTVTGGNLNFGIAGAIGTGLLTLGGGTLDNTSAGAITLSNNLQNWTGNFSYAGATQSLNMGTGAVTLSNNPIVTVNNNTLTVGGAISGAGQSLTKAGNGTLTLTSNNSSYSGGLTVNAGTVIVSGTGGNSSLGSGNTTVNTGGTLTGANADSFGFVPNAGTNNTPLLINVNGGAITDLSTANYRVTLPDLSFTGGTLTSAAGNAGDANGNYSFRGSIDGGLGNLVANVTTNASSTTATISAATVSLQEPVVVTVAQGTTPSGVDLLVSSLVKNFNATTNSLTKAGNGLMSLTGPNTYTGATIINGGTLRVGSAGALGPSGGISFGGGTLQYTASNQVDYSGRIGVGTNLASTGPISIDTNGQSVTYASGLSGTNSGGLTKLGAGTLTLNGTNNYTGPTIVSGGALTVNGSIENFNAPLTVGNQATLSGTGTISNSVTLNSGGTLANSIPVTVLTLRNGLTIGSVNTDTAAVNVTVNLGAPATAPIALTTLNTTPILNGAQRGTIVNIAAAGTLTAGVPYAIMNYAGPLDNTSFGTFALGALPNRVTAHLSNDANALDFIADTVDFPVWTGAASSEWSTNVISPPKNWVLNSNSASTTDYIQGDSVVFNDNPQLVSTAIDISVADVLPASVTFNNSTHDYTLSGSFGVAGGTALTKMGTGALTITNANTYSGGTFVQNGMLNANVAGALGAGPLTATGGVTNLNAANAIGSTGSVITVNGGTVNLATANASGSNPITLTSGNLNIADAAAAGTSVLTFNGTTPTGGTLDNTSGSPLTLANNNHLVLAGNFTYGGATQSLNMGTGAVSLSANSIVNVAANTLTIGGIVSDANGNTLTKTGDGTLVLSGVNTYTGPTFISGGALVVTNTSAAASSLGANAATSGTIAVNGGTLDLSNLTPVNTTGFTNRTFVISGTGVPTAQFPGGEGAIFSNNPVAQQNAFRSITLAADATIGGAGATTGGGNFAVGRYDLRGAALPAQNTLDLSGHTLTKQGSSQFTLVNTSVTAGNIVLASPGAFGTVTPATIGIETTTTIPAATNPDNSPSTITFNDNTNLEMFSTVGISTGTTPVTRNMIMNGTVLVSNGNATTLSTISSPITVNGTLRVDSAISRPATDGPITLTGNISGAGSLVKANNFTQAILTLTGNNTYMGGTTVSGGTLATTGTGTIGPGALTINPTGTASAILSIGGSSQSVQSLTASAPATATARVDVAPGNTLSVSGPSSVQGTLNKTGGGTLAINGSSTLASGSSLAIAGGTMQFDLSGSSVVGTGATAAVASGATLELDGTTSALTDSTTTTNRVNINNGENLNVGNTVVTPTTIQQVGAIDGTGTTTVTDGAQLTANHIVQGLLVIGSAGASPSLVTIAASDADGNAFGTASGLAVAGSLAPSDSFGSSTGSGSSLLGSDASATGGDLSTGGKVSSGSAAVPEPATIVLLGLAGLVCLGARLRR